jgi:hypothetical protein
VSKLKPYDFGTLPVEAVNKTLGLELDAGGVFMPVNAQRHVQNKRPEDFARLFPHIAAVVANPLYVGDDFKNEGKIELVGAPIALGSALLVAIELKQDEQGKYAVTSFYALGETTIANRREKNHLLNIRHV